jgi:hypothetical protein
MSYGAKGVPARFISVGPTTAAKASSEGWRLCLRPNICPNVGTCYQAQEDPTGMRVDVNRVLARDGKSSVNLASHRHCAGVFIGI